MTTSLRDRPRRTAGACVLALVRTPVAEKDGVYGEDPLFVDEDKRDLRVKPGSPAAKSDAEALPE